ncbi:unnamed protein product [Allacma fusca]|uniref:Uncharacterized protein n=1 Tax=Allacma fusca TaxID=39272 RepID=A0A8J2PDB2_9HEXA|nr:unnamed protein product [Allacma fusca]
MENSIDGGVDKSTAIQPGPRRYPEIKGEILERKEVTVRLISQMERKLRNDPTLDFLREESVRAARFYGCSPPITYQAQLYWVKTEFRDNIIPTESVLDNYRKVFLDTYLELARVNVHKGLPIQLYNLRRTPGIFTDYAPGTLMNDLEGKEVHWEPMKTQNEVIPTGSEVDLGPPSSSNSKDSVKEDGEPEAWIVRGEAMSIH